MNEELFQPQMRINEIPIDHVRNADSHVLFRGSEEMVVRWLEELVLGEIEKLWVYIEATGDVITASQYLDLAT